MATPEDELLAFFDNVRNVGYHGTETEFEALLDNNVALFRLDQNSQKAGRDRVVRGKHKVAQSITVELRQDNPVFAPRAKPQQGVWVIGNAGQVSGVADWKDTDGDNKDGPILYSFMFSKSSGGWLVVCMWGSHA